VWITFRQNPLPAVNISEKIRTIKEMQPNLKTALGCDFVRAGAGRVLFLPRSRTFLGGRFAKKHEDDPPVLFQ